MTISIPDALKSFVNEQVDRGSYRSSGDCVLELIRKDQERMQLRGLLQAGGAAVPTAPAHPAYSIGLRNCVRKSEKVVEGR